MTSPKKVSAFTSGFLSRPRSRIHKRYQSKRAMEFYVSERRNLNQQRMVAAGLPPLAPRTPVIDLETLDQFDRSMNLNEPAEDVCNGNIAEPVAINPMDRVILISDDRNGLLYQPPRPISIIPVRVLHPLTTLPTQNPITWGTSSGVEESYCGLELTLGTPPTGPECIADNSGGITGCTVL